MANEIKKIASYVSDIRIIGSAILVVIGAIIWGAITWNGLTNRVDAIEDNERDVQAVPSQITALQNKTDLTNQSVANIEKQLSEIKTSQKDTFDLVLKIFNLLK